MGVPTPAVGKCRVAEWLELPTLDHKVLGWNPAGGGIQLMTEQSLSF